MVNSIGLTARIFSSAEEFLDVYEEGMAGCLVTDLRLPGMSGADLQNELISNNIHIPVIIMTGYGSMSVAVRTLKNGTFDIFEKPFDQESMLDAIRKAIREDTRIRREKEEFKALRNQFKQLSKREREVLDLLVTGKPSKVIAWELGVSTKTVDVHRSRIHKKLQLYSVAELVRASMTINKNCQKKSNSIS